MSDVWRTELTVVVMSYNRGLHLEICLRTLNAHARGLRVVVVDDGSDDPYTNQVLDAHAFETLRTEKDNNARLGGLYKNMQTALKCINSRYILFLQDDSQLIRDLTAEDMQACEQAFEKTPALAFINPVIAMGPRGKRMRQRAQAIGPNFGFAFPFDGPKPNACRSFYQDIVLCHVQRLKSKAWTFGPTEDVTARRAGLLFSNMLHYRLPFVAQMPEVITQRFGAMSLAARLVNQRLGLRANFFTPIDEAGFKHMQASRNLVLAEDLLKTEYPTIKKPPYVHKAVSAIWWIQAINKLEVKWTQWKRRRY